MRAPTFTLACLTLAVPLLAQPAREMNLIAFGSCARERQPQPIWTEILATKPDLFLFIGDNNYADFWLKDGKMVMEPIPNIERLKEAYEAQVAQPGYRRAQREFPILATWDDHDFGANDGGKDFKFREESKQVFFDVYGFPPDAPIRTQPGVYQERKFGPEGRRVQVILLDTRFNRDPLDRATKEQRVGRAGPYIPSTDTSKTLLGDEQWRWLETQLKEPADIRVIASSIQVIADEHGHESWGNLPHERQRLYNLIASTNAHGVFFISGDRHLTEATVERGSQEITVPYPIWDFTSSGMTQVASVIRDPNSKRVGPVRRETTFGTLRFAWGPTPETTQIEFTALGDQGQMLTRQSIFLSDLRPATK